MGIFQDCINPPIDNKDVKIKQNDKKDYLNELFDTIIFNRKDYEKLISEITINNGLENNLYGFSDSVFLGQKYGINIQPTENNSIMKDFFLILLIKL